MEGGCCWDLVKRIQPIALPLALSLVTLVASTKKLRNSTDWRLQSPPVSLLEGSPSPLSLNMGTYMNKQELPARGEACGPRAIKEKLSRPNPSVATPIRRLSFRDPLSSSNRTYLCARRDYPLKQEIYSKPGSLPRVSLDGQSQQRVPLTPRHFTRRTPVTISPQDLKTRFQLAPQPNVVSSPHLDFGQEPCLPSIHHRVELETSVTHSHHLPEPEQYPASPSSHKANTFEATFSSRHFEDPCATEKENGEESKLLVNDSLCRTSKMEASRASWRSESSSVENLSQQSSISMEKKERLDIPRCDTPEWPLKKMMYKRPDLKHLSASQETMKTQMSETQKVENPTMLFSSSTKSSNSTNTSGFNSMGSVFGYSTVPPSLIVTPNKSLSITLGNPEK
ncbi:hypothetical protein XELAEV_18000314mg, partial [Xenopus laevis]